MKAHLASIAKAYGKKKPLKESVCKHNMITKYGNCAACGINVKKHKEKIATAKAAMQKMIGTISRVGIREGFTDYKKAAHHLAVKHGPFNVTNAHIKAYIDSCDSPHKIDPEEIKAALRKKQRNITVPVREGLSPKVAKVVEAVKRNKKQA